MRKPPYSSQYVHRSSDANEAIVDYVQVPPTYTETTVWATIQPVSAKILESLEAGLRTRALFSCFTYAPMKAANAGEPPSDFVVVDGVAYEVHGGWNDGDFPGCPIPQAREYVLAKPQVQ